MLQISPSQLPFLLVHPKCDLILNHKKFLAFPSDPSFFTSTTWINFGAARPLIITLRKFKLLGKAKNGALV
jgi:hypothetical protein